jgi:hypothetical protein
MKLEHCVLCGREQRLAWSVKPHVWSSVMGDFKGVSCLECFLKMSDLKRIEVSRGCFLFFGWVGKTLIVYKCDEHGEFAYIGCKYVPYLEIEPASANCPECKKHASHEDIYPVVLLSDAQQEIDKQVSEIIITMDKGVKDEVGVLKEQLEDQEITLRLKEGVINSYKEKTKRSAKKFDELRTKLYNSEKIVGCVREHLQKNFPERILCSSQEDYEDQLKDFRKGLVEVLNREKEGENNEA